MLFILVIEAILVLLGIAGLLLFLRWKQKKQKMSECEALLNKLHNEEQPRKTQLTERLKEQYSCNQEDADDSAEYMYEAEKQFIQLFLKKQLEQAPLGEFYEDLSVLLDQYLYFIPVNAEVPLSEKPEPESAPVLSEEKQENSVEDNKETEETEQEQVVDELPALEKEEGSALDAVAEDEVKKADSEADWSDAMVDLDTAIDESASKEDVD